MNINNNEQQGFGLLEVIMAVGLWVFLASAGIMMTTGSLRINTQSTDYDQAVLLASEGLDAARTIKKIGWTTPFLATSCVTGCGVATVSATWGFSGVSNAIGKYTRQVLVTPVNRDALGNIVASGGTMDEDTYKVESKVSWARTPAVTGTVSLVSYLTNYVKSIVSTLSGGILIYGDGTTTPKFRTYDRTSDSFSTEQSGPTGGVGSTFMLRTSPTVYEAIAGYVTSGGVLQVMCYDGTSWSNEWSVSVGGTATTRRFDIAYERNTGDVVVLYSTNTATTNELAYRTKPGTTGCGTANWGAAASLNPARTSGVVRWVKMAPDVRSTSNLITAIWADSNSDLSAMVWNGTGWQNEPTAALATTLEVVSSAQDVDCFDVTYESLSGDVMIAWALSLGSNGTNGVRYAVCTGGIASCTWTLNQTPPTFRDDATNLELASDPVSDQIIFASIGNAGSDLQTGYWSGTAWLNRANVDTSAGTPLAGTKLVATGWLANGATSRWVTVFLDSSGTGVSWYTGNTNGTPAKQTDFVATPAIAFPKKWIEIKSDTVNTEQMIVTISDVNNDLHVKKLTMTEAAVFTWSDVDVGVVFSANLTQAIVNPYAFNFWKQ